MSHLQDTGYTEDRFYIHCDGALFGLMVRFLTLKTACLYLPMYVSAIMTTFRWLVIFVVFALRLD